MGSRPIWLVNPCLKDVNPREAGEEVCTAASCASPFYRSHYLLHYVLAGEGTFYVDGHRYDAKKGHLIILHPGEVMRHETGAENPWHYGWIGFEISIPETVLRNRQLVYVPQAEHIFRAIITSDRIRQGREFYLCGLIYELLSILQQLETNSEQPVVDNILKVKEYMDSNYQLPITIEKIAQDMHMSRSYLSTTFHRYIGCSPQRYLMDVRLKRAAELLMTGSCSVGAAAVQCGYMDIYNFSRMFKKKYGVPPSEYAKTKEVTP